MRSIHRYPQLLHLVVVSVLLALPSMLTACGGLTTPNTTSTPAAINATVGQEELGATIAPSSLTATADGYAIKVYFSKFPDSLSNAAAVFPVNRTSPTVSVGTFAIQLLIAGPTLQERDTGYFSELNSILTGPSTCSDPHPTGGPDFKLTLNMKGPKPEQGTATVKFCRATASPGVGADARIQSEINATLKQFDSIKKVVILTKDGHCFGDESGQDQCLK
jgi:spore germination protein GerM